MTGFSESSTVQAAIVERLSGLGWEYIPGKDLPRTLDSAFVQPHLIDALIRLNPLIAEQPQRVDEVLPKLRAMALSAVNDGLLPANEKMTTWLRGHQTLKYIGTDDYLPVQTYGLPPALGEPVGCVRRGDVRAAGAYAPLRRRALDQRPPGRRRRDQDAGRQDQVLAERRKRHPRHLRSRGPRLLHNQRAVLRDRGPGVPLRRGRSIL